MVFTPYEVFNSSTCEFVFILSYTWHRILFLKKCYVCILGKKFIDVKNSCTVTGFSWDTEVSSLSPQILHSNFCLYIFEGFFFLEKRKIGLLDIVEIENKKRHFLKMPVLLRGQSRLSRFLDGVLQVRLICKRIYSENFSFFLLFFLCFGL